MEALAQNLKMTVPDGKISKAYILGFRAGSHCAALIGFNLNPSTPLNRASSQHNRTV